MKKETTVTIKIPKPKGWVKKEKKPKYVFLHNIVKRFLCSNNIHFWKVRYGNYYTPIDRTCKCCKKTQRMNIHLKCS